MKMVYPASTVYLLQYLKFMAVFEKQILLFFRYDEANSSGDDLQWGWRGETVCHSQFPGGRSDAPCRVMQRRTRVQQEQKDQGERVGENFVVPSTRKTKQDRVSRLVHAKLLQSYPTLCGHMDCSLPDSSVHGILQARILEWVAMPSPLRDLPDQGIEPVSLTAPALAGRFFTTSATREAKVGLGLPSSNNFNGFWGTGSLSLSSAWSWINRKEVYHLLEYKSQIKETV